jgi:hypothetical protein
VDSTVMALVIPVFSVLKSPQKNGLCHHPIEITSYNDSHGHVPAPYSIACNKPKKPLVDSVSLGPARAIGHAVRRVTACRNH